MALIYQNFRKILSVTRGGNIWLVLNDELNLTLIFQEVTVKIIDKNSGDTYVKWESFEWSFNLNDFNKNFWMNIPNKKPNKLKECFFHFNNWRTLEISGFRWIFDTSEFKDLNKLFSENSWNHEWKWRFILSMNTLQTVKLLDEILEDIKSNEEVINDLNLLLSSRKVIYSTHRKSKFHKIDQLFTLLPLQTEYSIYERYTKNENTNMLWLESLMKLDWSDKRISWMSIYNMLSLEEYKLICHIFSSCKSKGWLIQVSLFTKNLSESLHLLSLLYEYYTIQFINLRYEVSDLDKGEDKIEDAKKRFNKKVGFTCRLEICT